VIVMHLQLLNPALRIDWPLLLSTVAVGITLCGAISVALQVRRTRRRVLESLERVFEELDLLRLEAQPLPVADVPARQSPAPVQELPAAPAPRVVSPPPELADYQAAARLAAHGAPLAEIAERCGVVAGEARVLQALQRAAQLRASGQRAVAPPVVARHAVARPLRPVHGGSL
jgi:hypothetical protein